MDIQNILKTTERITYKNLVEKINNNELTTGKYYTFLYIPEMELDNYDTNVIESFDYDFDYSSNGFYDKYYKYDYKYTPSTKCFNLTVLAISSCRLGTIAYPSIYDYETYDENYELYYESRDYFLHTDFNKWVIYYDINNDKNKYEWASDKSTGVIFYMKDEFDNEACFDFKNFKIRVFRGYDDNNKEKGFLYLHHYLFDGMWVLADKGIPHGYMSNRRYNIDISVRHHNFIFNEKYLPPILCLMSIPKEVISKLYPKDTYPTTIKCFNNTVHPTYKTLANGQKLLLFPTCNFEITSDFAAKFPIANNCITSNCQGFTLTDCCNCNNTFLYEDGDKNQQTVNFYKQNGVINLETNQEIIYTNTDYWNLDTSDVKQLIYDGIFWPELYSSLRNTILGPPD